MAGGNRCDIFILQETNFTNSEILGKLHVFSNRTGDLAFVVHDRIRHLIKSVDVTSCNFAIKMEIGGLTVVNTHLPHMEKSSLEAFKLQIDTLTDWGQGCRGKYVLAGDFNEQLHNTIPNLVGTHIYKSRRRDPKSSDDIHGNRSNGASGQLGVGALDGTGLNWDEQAEQADKEDG